MGRCADGRDFSDFGFYQVGDCMKIVPRFSEDKEMFFLFAGQNCKPMLIICTNNTSDLFWKIDYHDYQLIENWEIVYYEPIETFETFALGIVGEHSRKKQLTKEFWEYVCSYENRFPPVFSI